MAGKPTAVEREALVVSHWFDAGEHGEPYSATVRLTGRRLGIHGQLKPTDTFVHEDKVDGIAPGSGPVSITSWVYGLQPGDWSITADLIRHTPHAAAQPADRWRRSGLERIAPVDWSWRRWRVSDNEPTAVRTRWAMAAPLARMPAVIPGSFTILSILAILAALTTQTLLLARESIAVGDSLIVSLLAIGFGLIAAKMWYAVLHPGPWRQSLAGGWSVDGFLVVAPLVAIGALLAFHLPIGAFLDAATPGIFFAVAIGRLGCFFTGCCAGRCTSSRFGIWSSDRRVGARRIPAQLIESAVGLVLGLASTFLILARVPGVSGVIFLGAMAVYVVVRQFLLRLRAERREFSWRRSRPISRGRS